MYTIYLRLSGDLIQQLSKILLIVAIHWNKSAEGVSTLTQCLYLLVVIVQQVEGILSPWKYWFTRAFMVLNILSTIYVLFLMRIYSRTPEKATAWRLTASCFSICAISALIINYSMTIPNYLWSFSVQLESVCILPQLELLRYVSAATVIKSGYLLTLCVSRILYVLNTIYWFNETGFFDPLMNFFNVVQILLYLDFAWVYYRRQRVKLHTGGVIDSDDLSRGFILRWILRARADGSDTTPVLTTDNEPIVGGDARPSVGPDSVTTLDT